MKQQTPCCGQTMATSNCMEQYYFFLILLIVLCQNSSVNVDVCMLAMLLNHLLPLQNDRIASTRVHNVVLYYELLA